MTATEACHSLSRRCQSLLFFLLFAHFPLLTATHHARSSSALLVDTSKQPSILILLLPNRRFTHCATFPFSAALSSTSSSTSSLLPITLLLEGPIRQLGTENKIGGFVEEKLVTYCPHVRKDIHAKLCIPERTHGSPHRKVYNQCGVFPAPVSLRPKTRSTKQHKPNQTRSENHLSRW